MHAPVTDFIQAHCTGVLSRMVLTPWGASYSLAQMLVHLVEHEIHHRAELSPILGMLGKPGLDA